MTSLSLSFDSLSPKVVWPKCQPTNTYCRFNAYSNIVCHFYPILRTTPKGVWVAKSDDKEIFINNSWKKKFAYPSIPEAFSAFIYRRKKQISILTNQLDQAKNELKLAQSFNPPESPMHTYYFTFGQDHRKVINGQVYDKDTVVAVSAPTYGAARKQFAQVFSNKWAFQYDQKPDMSHFPRGLALLPRTGSLLPSNQQEPLS